MHSTQNKRHFEDFHSSYKPLIPAGLQVVKTVDDWITAAVSHCQPVTRNPHRLNVSARHTHTHTHTHTFLVYSSTAMHAAAVNKSSKTALSLRAVALQWPSYKLA